MNEYTPEELAEARAALTAYLHGEQDQPPALFTVEG